MKLNSLIGASLLIIGAIAPITPTAAQQSAPVPGLPQQNDRRSPVAQINPSKPIQIRVANQSSVDIQVVLVEPTSRERSVKPQQSVTFGALHTSYLPPPIDLTIYTNVKDTNLRADIAVVNNELIVTVTSKPGTYGLTRSLEVNSGGAIYIY
ncbi:MAG: hypothetical protein MUE44_18960 [Oscillatoriaceae cyanobacterium Prado104]|jgi:hypothetical protein|nr:hypothetical protein [Oscillatoriaceae cyanobacterium Prado104]